jgi:large subunit ribosomal protein L18
MINLLKKKHERNLKAKRRSKGSLTVSLERPRLVVGKSKKYLYVQVIDDLQKKVLMSVSSIAKELKDKKLGKNIATAKILGQEIGRKLKENKINSVCFDRNGFKYHGKIKAIAEACREEGIKF